MPRNKIEKAVVQDTYNRAKGIAEDFIQFIDGWRVLFLMQRHRDGGETNNTKLRKIITKNPKEFIDALYELSLEKENSDLPLRIYSAVNERDFDKAIRNFKFEQLEADYYDQEQNQNFYLDIKNRFIGCLMQPRAAKTSLFLFDLDSTQELDQAHEAIFKAGLNDNIIKQYGTKNGWHIITKPFNPALVGDIGSKIKKDALLLLDY